MNRIADGTDEQTKQSSTNNIIKQRDTYNVLTKYYVDLLIIFYTI